MRSPKYPLEALRVLREHQADGARRDLASAIATTEAAKKGRRTAELRREEHEAAAARVREAEALALARGDLCAADLALAGAWEVRIALDRAALAAEVDRARQSEGRALQAEADAAGRARARGAAADLVARHRERFDDRARKRAEAADEDAAAEACKPGGTPGALGVLARAKGALPSE
jgi:hypothetical protein